MKFRFHCSAWSNSTYRREEILDLDVEPEEWLEMSDRNKEQMIDEAMEEWLVKDLSYDAEIVEEDLAIMDAIESANEEQWARDREEMNKAIQEVLDNPETHGTFE